MLWLPVRPLGFPIALFGTMGYIISGWNVQGLPQWPIDIGWHLHPLLCLLWLFQAFFLAPVGAKVAHSIDVKPLKNALPACSAAFAFTCLDKATYLAKPGKSFLPN